MDRHFDAALLGDRNDRLQEGLQIFPKSLFVNLFILIQQILQPFFGVAFVPTGQRQLAGQRIHRQHSGIVIRQTVGAIGVLTGQLAAQPVEHRHKVVADHFHARFAQPTHIFAVVFDQLRCFFVTQLDILRHGNAFHHFKFQPCSFGFGFQLGNALLAPNAARRHIVNRRHDPAHGRDLTDLFEGDGIAVAIPAKGQFHTRILLCMGERARRGGFSS